MFGAVGGRVVSVEECNRWQARDGFMECQWLAPDLSTPPSTPQSPNSPNLESHACEGDGGRGVEEDRAHGGYSLGS